MQSSFGSPGDDFYYAMTPMAVVKIDDYYRVVIKHSNSYKFENELETSIDWEIYKISSSGLLIGLAIFGQNQSPVEDELT